MKHARPRYLFSLALGTSALSLMACTGDLSGGSDSASSENAEGDSQAMDARTAEIAAEIAATDRELQEIDADLYDTARQYFPSDDPGSPKPRYYRLTRRQLDNTAEQVLPGHFTESAEDLFQIDPLIRNYELANDLGFNGANFPRFVTWLTQAVEKLRLNPELLIDCSGSGSPEACQEQAAEEFIRRSFRGVPDDATVQRFVDFFTDNTSPTDAVADLADVVLSSPHFAFREEVHAEADGQLPAAQALQNITYTLADVPPSALGLDEDAPEQYFATDEARENVIADILATPQARDKLLRFFIAWLEIREPDTFDISENIFPEFTPEIAQAMVTETEDFLRTQLASVAPTLHEITESNESFVSEALNEIYGIEGAGREQLTALPESERYGIFTHPSFIASHSGPTTTRLVKRGAYFTRKVMCQELGEPPPDAIPVGPIPGDTERERIAGVTEPAACAGCHNFINPFGFMLEAYDPLGRFRTEDENGFPVDTSIEALFLDEGPLVTDVPVDALAQFTEAAMFRQCFVRQLFTFYTARTHQESDDPLLREMFFRFSEGDNQQLPQLLSILGNSNNFNRRIEDQ